MFKRLTLNLFLIFSLLLAPCYAQEQIEGFDEENLGTLNEELRKIIEDIKGVDDVTIEIDSDQITLKLAPVDKGGLGEDFSSSSAGSMFYFDGNGNVGVKEKGTDDTVWMMLGGVPGWQSFDKNQAFTSSGTFTVPAGITLVSVSMCGGGAGGGGENAGGGGGGASHINVPFVVTPAEEITITVGAGGAGGTTGGGANGEAGGATIFDDGGTRELTANGGTFASGGAAQVMAASGATAGIPAGFAGGNGESGVGQSGGGSMFGFGSVGSATPATPTVGYGGGGGGDTDNGTQGAAGKGGICIIEW